MDDERFRLNKSNVIVLIIDIILFILTIISIVLLVNSFKDESKLPDLEVTKQRTSTIVSRTTTKETTTTTTTTTRRNLTSPYYSVDVNSLLSSELFTKSNLNKDEALEVAKELFNVASSIINTSDNSLLDIETTIDYAKVGEKDVVDNEGVKYGIIYNGKELLEKVFSLYYINSIYNVKIGGNKVILNKNNNYYRMENKLGNINLIINEITISTYSNSNITANILYYKSNYKEEGYSAPVYKKMNIALIYENKRWRVSEFKYPLTD